MNRLTVVLIFLFLIRLSPAQSAPAPNPSTAATNAAPRVAPPTTAAALESEIDRLTQSNHDLLDLLKKQQAVLEDIQYDRRLQSRQLQNIEERLEETLLENAQLQNKVANLEAAAATSPAKPSNTANPPPVTTVPQAGNVSGTDQSAPAPVVEPAPSRPATYLPSPEPEGAPDTKSWHRLFTLSGTDNKNSDLFQIQGPQWRVLWHNQDKDGKAYKNTSALFISAFPKDDTIPQKVCAKLGSGGDSTELNGPGNYYLKIEASGGAWELAVEDFR